MADRAAVPAGPPPPPPGGEKSVWLLRLLAGLAVAFGVLTVYAGGRALFGGPAARAGLGHIVPFVLWFNFAAGFPYVLSGVGLLFRARWAAALAALIAVATVFVFVMFGLYVFSGGAYEARTVGAMAFRSAVWIAIAAFAWRVTARARQPVD